MILRSCSIAILAWLLSGGQAEARIDRYCMVAYQTGVSWYREYRMEVAFLSGRELNQATRSRQYDMNSVYVALWFDDDEVAVIELDTIRYSWDAFTDRDFRNLFILRNAIDGVQVNGNGGLKWRITAKDPYWVDPRVR